MGEALSFYFLAFIISVLSVAVVTVRKPVVAVALLVFNLFFLAGVYALLEAHFIAVIQVIIYAGAILVLFMFVIMLLDADAEIESSGSKGKKLFVFSSIIIGFAFFGLRMFQKASSLVKDPLTAEILEDNTYEVGLKLFEDYVWPFELASFLILLAIVASIFISRKPSQNKSV